MSTTAMTFQLPPHLAQQLETYVQAGWFSDVDTLVVEALRRYLETHQLELQEQFLREDVEWGLRGRA